MSLEEEHARLYPLPFVVHRGIFGIEVCADNCGVVDECEFNVFTACTNVTESRETSPVMGIASTRIPLRAASDAMRRPTGVTGVTSPYPT